MDIREYVLYAANSSKEYTDRRVGDTESRVEEHETRIESLENNGGAGGTCVDQPVTDEELEFIFQEGVTDGAPNKIQIDLNDIKAKYEAIRNEVLHKADSAETYTKTEIDRLDFARVKTVNGVSPDTNGNVILTDASLPAQAIDVESRNTIDSVTETTENLIDNNAAYVDLSMSPYTVAVPIKTGIHVENTVSGTYRRAAVDLNLKTGKSYALSFRKLTRSGNDVTIAWRAQGGTKLNVLSRGSDPDGERLVVRFTPSDDNITLFFFSVYSSAGIGNVDFFDLMLQENDYSGRYAPYRTAVDTKAREQLDTSAVVFWDDFDTDLDTSKWKRIVASKDSIGAYYSRFKTDNENAYTDSSCLVIKCMRDDSPLSELDKMDDGTIRPLKAAYVSTEDTFAIRTGKISARIKVSGPITMGFPFTFFTFGQSNDWGITPEFDIIELTSVHTGSDHNLQNGHFYPAGTQIDQLAMHTHYRDRSNNETISCDALIYYEKNQEYIYNTGFDPMEWHVYAVEWNAKEVIYTIDDKPFKRIDVSSYTDTIWDSPQDIRLNVKAKPWCIGDDYAIYVDWVKVEDTNKTPMLSIRHDDIVIPRDQITYLHPTFIPENTSNVCFDIEVEDSYVCAVSKYLKDYQLVRNGLWGFHPGTTNVTIKSANGRIKHTFAVTVV